VAAGRGVLFRPRPPGVPGFLAEGRRPAPVLVPARQVQRHRLRHPGPAAAVRSGRAGPLVLPGAGRAALDRRVRATDRLTRHGAGHNKPIKDLARQLLPLSPLRGDLGAAGLAVLERYADPRALTRAEQAELTAVIARAPDNHLGAARGSLQLQGGHPAPGFAGLAAEVATEIRLLRAICAELAAHAAERETRYRQAGPAGLARSLPGPAEVGGPALVACTGDPARFATGKKFRSFTGLAPRASQTGETDRKGQPMSKAGSSLLRTTLVRAADTARKQDPQLARTYYQQMTGRGQDHPGALCVVAASLAERAWTVMRRGTPMSSATPTAGPSPRPRPRPSSPSAGPCHPKS
jgi:hypothetical protein